MRLFGHGVSSSGHHSPFYLGETCFLLHHYLGAATQKVQKLTNRQSNLLADRVLSQLWSRDLDGVIRHGNNDALWSVFGLSLSHNDALDLRSAFRCHWGEGDNSMSRDEVKARYFPLWSPMFYFLICFIFSKIKYPLFANTSVSLLHLS